MGPAASAASSSPLVDRDPGRRTTGAQRRRMRPQADRDGSSAPFPTEGRAGSKINPLPPDEMTGCYLRLQAIAADIFLDHDRRRPPAARCRGDAHGSARFAASGEAMAGNGFSITFKNPGVSALRTA